MSGTIILMYLWLEGCWDILRFSCNLVKKTKNLYKSPVIITRLAGAEFEMISWTNMNADFFHLCNPTQ